MNAEQLKNSILQRAIEGKLVEQREEEGTAAELLKEIRAEKARLVKEGKIKKEKPLPEIKAEEKPFEIPESWEWVRIQDISTKLVDGDHNPPKGESEKTEYIMISSTNINANKLCDLQKVRYLSKDVFIKENERTQATKGDIFFTSVGSLGRSCIYDGSLNICFQRSVSVITTLIYNKFLKYTFDSSYFQNKVQKEATGTAQKGFYLKQLSLSLVPLPPLAEQKRIVAKIEELLPHVEQYGKAHDELSALNEKFPDAMKKSVLQYAMEGKLVEQREEEGTAKELLSAIKLEKAKLVKEGKLKKEKPLPEIKAEEIPFEIPESWEWVRLSDIVDVRDGTHDTPQYHATGIPLITSKNISQGYLDFSNTKNISEEDAKKINERSKVDIGDILFAMIGSIGNPVIVNINKDFCIKNVALFKNYPSKPIDTEFLYYFLMYEQNNLKKIASGAVQSFISLKVFRKCLFPLPPLAEQKRIVAKIEELLACCGRLGES